MLKRGQELMAEAIRLRHDLPYLEHEATYGYVSQDEIDDVNRRLCEIDKILEDTKCEVE